MYEYILNIHIRKGCTNLSLFLQGYEAKKTHVSITLLPQVFFDKEKESGPGGAKTVDCK